MVYQTYDEHNRLKHGLLRLVNLMRVFTVRIPSRLLYRLLWLLVPVVLATCYLPTSLAWRVPGGRRLATHLPYNYEQYRYRRIRDIHMNLFDCLVWRNRETAESTTA